MSKKKSVKKSYSQKFNDLRKIKFLLLGTLLGLSVGGLVVMIVTSVNKSQVMHDTRNYHPATYAVAEKFMCGCPDCEMELVNCDCNNSAGGTYELYYISERLKEGFSEEQVIKDVNDKFGRIKNKNQHQINK